MCEGLAATLHGGVTMVFENVVVAYDGSDQALAAVKKAAEIVGGEEAAKLHVVTNTT